MIEDGCFFCSSFGVLFFLPFSFSFSSPLFPFLFFVFLQAPCSSCLVLTLLRSKEKMQFSFLLLLFTTWLGCVFGGCTDVYVNASSKYNRITGTLPSQGCMNIFDTYPTGQGFGLQLMNSQSCPLCADFIVIGSFKGTPNALGFYCSSESQFWVTCKPDNTVLFVKCRNAWSGCKYDFQLYQGYSASFGSCNSSGCSPMDLDDEDIQMSSGISGKVNGFAKLPSCNGCFVQFGSDIYACCNGMSIYNGQCSCRSGPCVRCNPSPFDKRKILDLAKSEK